MVKSIFLFILLVVFKLVNAQTNCQLTFHGHISDKTTNAPLENAQIFIIETKQTTLSDSKGHFEFKNLCEGNYHLIIKHFNCKPIEEFIRISENTHLDIELNHQNHLVQSVEIRKQKKTRNTEWVSGLSTEEIQGSNDQNLASALQKISGVSIQKSGNTIAKPILHGLQGNKISILNQGIPQAGQQWGADHAPEIDYSSMDEILVVKGASSLLYGTSNLGGVIISSSQTEVEDPHLHGNISYQYSTNGRAHKLHGELRGIFKNIQLNTKFSKSTSGDLHTPNYFLTNTSRNEWSGLLSALKEWKNGGKTSFFYSIFNAKLGILRGAHIGNLTDLKEALNREIPFFTSPEFSTHIAPPYQLVQHHLWKLHHNFYLKNGHYLSLTYAAQLNLRKEFDVRRLSQNIPSLSVDQWQHYLEGRYKISLPQKTNLTLQLQGQFTDNQNDALTGVVPFVPSFFQYLAAWTGIIEKKMEKHSFDIGGRLEFRNYQSNFYENNRQNDYQNSFFSGQLAAGWRYTLRENLFLKSQLGFSMRPPEIQELLSRGLHQGLASFEIGNQNLQPEKAIKVLAGIEGMISQKISIEAIGFFQYFPTFIFLAPQDSFLLTIRGAFPFFATQQVKAHIFGNDLTLKYRPIEALTIGSILTVTRGFNYSDNTHLVWIPQDRVRLEIAYQFPKIISNLENTFVGTAEYHWKMGRLAPNQDFVAPPPAFGLISAKYQAAFRAGKNKIVAFFSAENILNTRYRSYLNRQRYFSDEMGRNIEMGCKLQF